MPIYCLAIRFERFPAHTPFQKTARIGLPQSPAMDIFVDNHREMAVELITKEDFILFKKQLFEEMKQLFKDTNIEQPKWLKAPQVRKLLSISPGTLQNLWINGTLPYTKIGGATYYALSDIEKVMRSRQIHNV